MRSRQIATLIMAMALSGCANDIAQRTPTPAERIGRTPGDSIQQISGYFNTGWSLFNRSLDGRPVALASVLRAANVGGKTHLCGAVVIAGDDEVIDEMERLINTYRIAIFLGPSSRPFDYRESVVVSSLKIHRLRQTGGAVDIPLARLLPVEANCNQTQLAWNSAFQGSHRLQVLRGGR